MMKVKASERVWHREENLKNKNKKLERLNYFKSLY